MIGRFNEWLATVVTRGVGTMWCAYLFAGIAAVGLPDALHDAKSFVSWLSSQFLQLVLLSIIIVGQKLLDEKHTEIRDLHEQHHEALHEIKAAVHGAADVIFRTHQANVP